MRLLVRGGIPLAGRIVGIGAGVTRLQPTPPTDVLTAEGEIAEITSSRSRPNRGLVKVRTTTRR